MLEILIINNIVGKEISNMEKNQTITNCHRTSADKNKKSNTSGSSVDADQDSSTSKYVVEEDNRKRQDGPGGN